MNETEPMKSRTLVLGLAVLCSLLATGSARSETSSTQADDFGFGDVWEKGTYRTEYPSPLTGTKWEPIDYVSVPEGGKQIRVNPLTFPFSFANTNNPRGWVTDEDQLIVVANNDLSLEARCPAGGPPDQSAPIGGVKSGELFGLGIWDSSRWKSKVHTLEINNNRNPCVGGIPYLGIGVFHGTGRRTPVGFLNRQDRAGSQSELWLQVEEYRPGKPVGYQIASGAVHVMAIAEWNGRKHMLFVNLFSEGARVHGAAADWNWPYRQSPFFPGARVAFLEGPPVGISYLSVGVARKITIDWQQLYKKASDMGLWGENPLPEIPVPITAFEVSIEVTGMDAERAASNGDTQFILSVWGVRQL